MHYTSKQLRRIKGRNAYRGVLNYKDEDGHWRSRTKTLSATTKTGALKELERWHEAMEAEHELLTDGGSTGSTATVPDFLDCYIERKASQGSIEGATISTYRGTARYVRQAFEGVALADLTFAAVQEWEGDMLAQGYSTSTVGKAHRLLKSAMNDALYMGLVQLNPLNRVKPPKRVKKNPGINALDLKGRSQVLDMLDLMAPTPVTVGARIALYTGLREGEACGLQWRDVEPSTGVLWVRRSIARRGGGTYVKSPKTDRERDVAIPSSLKEDLEDWRARQESVYALKGRELSPRDYILGPPGGYYSPNALGKGWKQLAAAMGVRGTEGRLPTFHDLRHTYASTAVAAGIDIKTVSSSLGHSNAAMTLNIYASADPDAKRRAAEVMDRVMRG